MDELLLRADALLGLLDGWVGPVVRGNHPPNDYEPSALLGTDPTGPDAHVDGFIIITRGEAHFEWYGEVPSYETSGFLFLDLSLPECRDRVARVLAKVLDKGERGSTAPTWHCWEDKCGSYWELGWTDSAIFTAIPEAVHEHERDAMYVVPFLADLDPELEEELPDGSRFVDAHALKLVALHVGAMRR